MDNIVLNTFLHIFFLHILIFNFFKKKLDLFSTLFIQKMFGVRDPHLFAPMHKPTLAVTYVIVLIILYQQKKISLPKPSFLHQEQHANITAHINRMYGLNN